MNSRIQRANDVKHRLRQEGHTLKSWAAQHGYQYRDVTDVVRGIRIGLFGKGREIAEALGMLEEQA